MSDLVTALLCIGDDAKLKPGMYGIETRHIVAVAAEAAARIEALEAALVLAQTSEQNHMNCPDCDGDIEAELCETCFPAADAARLARWAALGIKPTHGRVINFEAVRRITTG